MIAIVLVRLDERVLVEVLSSGRVRWRLFRLATQAPEQVASRDVGDHGKQHQEHGDPKNPTVVHPLPTSVMGMTFVMFVIMLCLVHRSRALVLSPGS